jgi:hypothetical protein
MGVHATLSPFLFLSLPLSLTGERGCAHPLHQLNRERDRERERGREIEREGKRERERERERENCDFYF